MTEAVPVHEVSTLIPPMDEAEYRELVEDIREHGLREPIWLYQGQIIDGRHRARACAALGIEPAYREWDGEGSLVAFVISLNLRRRHLTAAQKAAVAADMLPLLESEAVDRMLAGKPVRSDEIFSDPSQSFDQGTGKATQQAGSVVGVNRQYVSDAKRIKRQSPATFELMREGRVTVPEARELARLPDDVRASAIQQAKAEPARKVTSIVREARRTARENLEETARGMLAAGIKDPDGNYARATQARVYGERMDQLMACITDLDPDALVASANDGDRSWLPRELARITEWVRLVEAALDHPLRLVVGGRDDV